MQILSWKEFNEILTLNSVKRVPPKNGTQLFLQHYESYFENTAFGSGRAISIEIREQVNFSALDVKLTNAVLIPNEYATPVLGFYLCLSGKVTVDFFKKQSISTGQWGLYSVPEGTYNFRIYGTDDHKYQILGVHFSRSSFQQFFDKNYDSLPVEIKQNIQNNIPYSRTGNYPVDLHDRILQLMNSEFDKLHDKLRLEGIIYEVMSYVLASFKREKPELDRKKIQLMESVCKTIKENPFSGTSTQSMAQEIGMSESLFYKTFKSIYGVSPNQFVVENKLLNAKQLLEEGDVSVNEVSFRCGYESVSSFSRIFQHKFGLRPGEIIRKRT